MTARIARRSRSALAATAIVAAIVVTVVAFARPGSSPGPAFPPLHPAAAPAGWARARPLLSGWPLRRYRPGRSVPGPCENGRAADRAVPPRRGAAGAARPARIGRPRSTIYGGGCQHGS